MVTIGCMVSDVVRVPDLRRYWSIPTRPHMFPAGQLSSCSTYRPIMSRTAARHIVPPCFRRG